MSVGSAAVIIFFLVVGALITFAIAAVFVGGETFRLRTTPTSVVFDLDEAVQVIADGLSTEAAVGLTYDEVRSLVGFSLDHLEAKGLIAAGGDDIAPGDTPEVVVADDDAVATVLGRADAIEMVVTDTAVFEVLELLLEHLRDIGAVGPSAV